MKILGTIDLAVQLAIYSVRVNDFVCNWFATSMILGANVYEKLVRTNLLGHEAIELNEETKIAIRCCGPPLHPNDVGSRLLWQVCTNYSAGD